MIKTVAGAILIIWGYIDGVKYHLEAQKIKLHKSGRGHSRMFVNMAVGNDFYRLFYFFFIDRNYYVLITSIIALIFMIEMGYYLYIFYPYKHRGLNNFKRPNILIYLYNSLQPNKWRRRL